MYKVRYVFHVQEPMNVWSFTEWEFNHFQCFNFLHFSRCKNSRRREFIFFVIIYRPLKQILLNLNEWLNVSSDMMVIFTKILKIAMIYKYFAMVMHLFWDHPYHTFIFALTYTYYIYNHCKPLKIIYIYI